MRRRPVVGRHQSSRTLRGEREVNTEADAGRLTGHGEGRRPPSATTMIETEDGLLPVVDLHALLQARAPAGIEVEHGGE